MIDAKMLNEGQGFFMVLPELRGISGNRRVPDGVIDPNVKAELPPEVLVSPGTMRFVKPKFLTPLSTFRSSIRSSIKAIAVAHVSAYLVPMVSDKELEEIMAGLERDAEAVKSDLIENYPAAVDDWCKVEENRPFEDAIRLIAPPVGYLEGRIQFTWDCIGFGAAANSDHPLLVRKAQERQLTLPDLLLRDIAETLEKLMKDREEEILKGVSKINRKGLGPLKMVSKKLDSFKAVAPWAAPLAEYVLRIVNMLDSTNAPLVGLHRRIYLDLLSMLSDYDSILAFSQDIGTMGVDKAFDLAVCLQDPQPMLDLTPTAIAPAIAPVAPVAPALLPVGATKGGSLPVLGSSGVVRPAAMGRRVVA